QVPRRVSLRPLKLVVSVLALTLAVACGGETSVGEASLGVSAQALSESDISRVTVKVSGAGISPDISRNLFKTSGQWSGTLGGIPVGSGRTFLAQAYDSSNNVLYEGQVTGVTISQGSTAAVFVLLQQKKAPNPFSNSAPRVSSLVASSTQVEPGQSITLSVAATDADGDTLRYAWTATAGTLANATTAAPTWTAPTTEGPHTVSVGVTDGKGGQAGFSLVINVLAAKGRASVTTSFNTWPVVSQVSVTKGQLLPGDSTGLDVTAVDPDGDSLTYTWNDTCGGSFSSTTAKSPTWKAPATSGTCTVSVAPKDGRGGSTQGSLSITIGLPEVPNAAPVIDQTFQSAGTVAAGGTLSVLVVAHDPEGTALSFTWSDSGGTMGTPTTSASQSEVLWTAPDSGGPFTLTAVVKDAGGAQATHTFTVSLP
ncbi:MAG TPA: kelch-like protein, partial [Myxococcaceae bacterium]|nr:kelch-like protein [Myxococcaceae bacterium]